ncbi:helix-turn-helix domain-containing protein [Aeribacillus pallidus]|uniref:helix-turn-helix domain-containing protein n=1 Tax=Aeribacillus pallidus TaxID=33936 RepID=UPI000E3436D4|nr:helix-turn-helix transcriptional regulator [Aeribacillus pallidus]
MSDFKKELGSRVRRIRKEKGLTLEEMAKATGITNSALSKIERGAVSVSAENLSLISRVLGVSNDFLLYGEAYLTSVPISETNDKFTSDSCLQEMTDRASVEDDKIKKSPLFKKFLDLTIKCLKGENSSVSLDPEALMNLFKASAALFADPSIKVSENEMIDQQNDENELSPEEQELIEILRQLDDGDKFEIMTIARMKRDITKRYGKRKGMSSTSISEGAAASEKRYDKFA